LARYSLVFLVDVLGSLGGSVSGWR